MSVLMSPGAIPKRLAFGQRFIGFLWKEMGGGKPWAAIPPACSLRAVVSSSSARPVLRIVAGHRCCALAWIPCGDLQQPVRPRRTIAVRSTRVRTLPGARSPAGRLFFVVPGGRSKYT